MTSQDGYSSPTVISTPFPGTPVLLHHATSPTAPRSDQHLVDEARLGSRAAFNELWNLYSHRIYLTALKVVKNPHDAEDALQDAFLRAFLAIESFEGRASFYVWLTRIAINSALGILRKRRRMPETSLDSTSRQEYYKQPIDLRDFAPGPEQAFDRQERSACLAQAMCRLPVRLQEVLHTLIAEECTVREVADRLNISYITAKSRLYRARAILSVRMPSVRASTPDTRKGQWTNKFSIEQ